MHSQNRTDRVVPKAQPCQSSVLPQRFGQRDGPCITNVIPAQVELDKPPHSPPLHPISGLVALHRGVHAQLSLVLYGLAVADYRPGLGAVVGSSVAMVDAGVRSLEALRSVNRDTHPLRQVLMQFFMC